METRICSKCLVDKSIESFSFKNKKKNKRHYQCRDCTSKNTKNHYKNNKQYYKDKAKKKYKETRKINLQFIINYLKEHPCVDCGEKDPVVLEFDHIRDKYKNVSRLLVDKCSLDKIKEEIAKCEVRCSNCHARKTAKQFGWYKDIVL